MYSNQDKLKLQTDNPWLKEVTFFESTDSTQKEAKKSKLENHLFITDTQSATYGRFGRPYFAAASGQGIYMSLLIQPSAVFEELPQYTLLTAAAVVSAIEKLTDKKPLIKWVNDIYLDNKKICGILSEAVVKDGQINQIIIGLGLNYFIEEFPDDLKDKAGSLFNQQVNVSRTQLISTIWSEFKRLESEDFLKIYKEHSFIIGRQIGFSQNNIDYEGWAEDLTDTGELVVRLSNGERKLLSSGEISIKKWSLN